MTPLDQLVHDIEEANMKNTTPNEFYTLEVGDRIPKCAEQKIGKYWEPVIDVLVGTKVVKALKGKFRMPVAEVGRPFGIEFVTDTPPSTLPDSGKRSKFTTGAVRDASEGKGCPSLIPVAALRAVAKRFEDGATKYGRNNWQKGIPLSRYVDSLQRHLWQFMEGDTTEDHLGAIIWNAMCLTQTKKWIDMGKLPADLDDLCTNF